MRFSVERKIQRRANGSLRVQTVFPEGSSPVQQQFKDEVDINRIMKKYRAGVPITHLNRGAGFYADFTEVKDYGSALNSLAKAQSSFMQLPAQLRARFGNDPGQLLQFLSDKNNRDEAIKLGLVTATAPNANDSTNANPQPPQNPGSPPASTPPSTSPGKSHDFPS